MKNKLFKSLTLAFALLIGLPAIASCSKEDGMINYVDDPAIRLKHDYVGKDFLTQGIAEVELVTAIDGDTAHFKQKSDASGKLLKARFYGVDTPESTGAVEPFGFAASNYTKSILKEAKTIVMTGESLDLVPPNTDSTGTRYVSMIWVSKTANANYKDLRNLNLMLVQNGYSSVKGLDKIPSFENVFLDANIQAQDHKLVIYSGEPDPLYNYGEYRTVSLFDIQAEVIKRINGETEANPYHNQLVQISGTIAGYTNHILFLQASRVNETTGKIERCGINVFTGMGSIPLKFQKVNTEIKLCGLALESENFGFQITDVKEFPRVTKDPVKYPYVAHVLKTPEEVIGTDQEIQVFDKSVNDLSGDTSLLNLTVSITEEVTVTGGKTSKDSNKIATTLYIGEKGTVNIFQTFAYKPYEDSEDESLVNTSWKKAEDFIGHTFKFTGIYTSRKYDDSYSYQIVPRNADDIILIK